MKFNKELLVHILLCIIAINEASEFRKRRRHKQPGKGDNQSIYDRINNDNPGFRGFSSDGVSLPDIEPSPVIVLPVDPGQIVKSYPPVDNNHYKIKTIRISRKIITNKKWKF